MDISFTSKIWRYQGDSAWYFVSLPTDIAEDIKAMYADQKRGFGSLKVSATVGDTTWNTSIFPDTKSKTYLLPIKKDVRTKEQLDADSNVQIKLTIL